MLACTSDKSTLHIFDVPHPNRRSRQQQQQQPQQQQNGGSRTPGSRNIAVAPDSSGNGVGSSGGEGKGKWGFLSKIPMMPRVFSDVYSFASAPFEADDDEAALVGGALPVSESTTLGTSRPPKGVVGWVSESTLLVIGAGRDARWERFVLQEGLDGRRHCVREGWKRYLPGH
jgi:hypothetical protein